MQSPISILFVCMGNICRSPLAQGVFHSVAHQKGMTDRFHLDSAGTGGWHVGDPPDSRGQKVARLNGFDISGQRCRQIQIEDFDRFDLILGMDHNNISNLNKLAPSTVCAEIDLFMSRAGLGDIEIPDPYYGDQSGFEETCGMLLDASKALLTRIT